MTVTNLKLTRRSNLYRKSTKNPAGTSYQLKDIVTNIKLVSTMDYSAGELSFDLVQNEKPIIPYTGDQIAFSWDKKKVFYGYVWKYTLKKNMIISVVCYDKLRYLKNEDTIVFKTNTAAARFKDVCKRANVKCKVVKAPTTKLKGQICEGKTYFAMMQSALNKTFKSSGHKYFIIANYDVVELRRIPHKKIKFYVGDASGMTDFTYSVDIEKTSNVIKVIKSDSKKSKIAAATTVSGKSKQQWGSLQKVITAKEKANKAQMVTQAKNELKKSNVANKTLSITCIGDLDLMPGNAVTIKIKDYSKTLKNCPIIKATHNFGDDYTCQLEMKAGKSWQASD